MSTHPNAILLLTLTPANTTRKTYRAILDKECPPPSYDGDKPDLKIGDAQYHHTVMEGDYEDDYQIAAKEGDIIFFDMITYGYGETIAWGNLEKQKRELEEWATRVCREHDCEAKFFITANYW